MDNSSRFIKMLAAGTVAAMIILGIAVIYALHIMQQFAEQERVNSLPAANPFLNNTAERETSDNDIPVIPGITVYKAEEDSETIIAGTPQQEKLFRKSLKNSTDPEKAELFRKKDRFAAERLAFLKKIEAAQTREECLKLIDELRSLCEKNNKTSSPPPPSHQASKTER